MSKYAKIHIIGGPGSGKTYLAKKMADLLNCTHIDLDNLFWDNDRESYNNQKPASQRDKELKEILKQSSWVIEGVYGGWPKPSFKQADIILILEPDTSLRQFRITKRFIQRKIGLTNSVKKESWKNFKGLFKWSKNYTEKNLLGIKKELKPYINKVRIIRENRPVPEELLK